MRTSVKVELIDANDHDPRISFRYFPDQTARFATVEENAVPGNLVAAITVTDRDKVRPFTGMMLQMYCRYIYMSTK